MPSNRQHNWTLLFPIHNLVIDKEIGGELSVGEVLFVTAEKIPRIRKRLGLALTVAEYKKRMRVEYIPEDDPFSGAKTYAVVRTRRDEKAPLTREFNLINEAVYLLASSQFFRTKRHSRILFGGPEFGKRLIETYPLLCSDVPKWRWSRPLISPVEPYRLNKAWRGYIRYHHFPHLLTILDKRIETDKDWRHTLTKASILAGQSFFARNIWEAYLYDMIAIETLLTRQGEKFPDAIIDKVVAFFGWITNEDSSTWKEAITHLYKLRCEFVHDGEVGSLTVDDLHDADTILGNLLYNLCALPKEVRCKQDIFDRTERYMAQKTLGIKIKRPNGLRFQQQQLTEHDYKKLKDPKHWYW